VLGTLVMQRQAGLIALLSGTISKLFAKDHFSESLQARFSTFWYVCLPYRAKAHI
jgi:hypothetical protein